MLVKLSFILDIVKPKKKFRKPNDVETKAFKDLINTLDKINDNQSPQKYKLKFSIGKKYYEKDKLRMVLKLFMKLYLEMNKVQEWDHLLNFME